MLQKLKRNKMVKKRERLEIIRDILQAIFDTKVIKPTRLLYSSNLSPQMFKEYVGELLGKELISEKKQNKNKTFTLTKKGMEFLKRYKELEMTIKNFGL
jgi:predicted transcriptional regulator